MFTGIIQGLGKIGHIKKSASDIYLKIYPEFEINDYQKGESIAVNGVCLTVESFDNNSFNTFASSETLNKTNLNKIKTGSKVNLERAIRANDRLGGHLVTGHIDGVAIIQNIINEGSSIKLTFKISSDIIPFIVAKGSVCLDGISLTINHCCDDLFDVNIIPETQTTTTIKNWQIGDNINIETDIIGKYVYKNLCSQAILSKSNITPDFLKQNGFM